MTLTPRDLTPEQLDEIERRAKAATPGPWTHIEGSVGAGDVELGMAGESDAAHIAASNPATVLSLIAEVRRLRREHEVACEALADALENSQAQRSNLCWLAGRAEAVVRDYNRLVAELRRHVSNG